MSNLGSANAAETFAGGRMTNLEQQERDWHRFVFANGESVELHEMERDIRNAHVRAIADKKYSGTAYNEEGKAIFFQGIVPNAGQAVETGPRLYSEEELEGFGVDFLKKHLAKFGVDGAGMNKATLKAAIQKAQASGTPVEPATPAPKDEEEADTTSNLPNVPPPPGN